MKYRCSYNSDLNIIETVTHGQASIAELNEMVRRTAEFCAQKYSANLLVDHSELDASLLSMEQVQELATLVVSLKDNFKGRKVSA